MNQGELVRVHYNLQTHLWSVSKKIQGKGWRVVGNLEQVHIADATPRVSLAGVATTRRGNRRRVCAWIEGTLTTSAAALGDRIHFNPHRSELFHRDVSAPESTAWRGGGGVAFLSGGIAHLTD